MAAMLGLAEQPDFSHGSPPESSIPQYVHHLYNVTHSLVVFLILFLLVWALVKWPVWELSAWGLHVLMDIPLHSFAFFPTPFLWPLSDWKFNGRQWMTPSIVIPNATLLILLYAWYCAQLKRRRGERRPLRISQSER
ncbi:MAG: metal-dependent hydrolase [Nitrospiraceae bacterium]